MFKLFVASFLMITIAVSFNGKSFLINRYRIYIMIIVTYRLGSSTLQYADIISAEPLIKPKFTQILLFILKLKPQMKLFV